VERWEDPSTSYLTAYVDIRLSHGRHIMIFSVPQVFLQTAYPFLERARSIRCDIQTRCYYGYVQRTRSGSSLYQSTASSDALTSLCFCPWMMGHPQCNVFRPFQGWTSMSTTRANEGTLQVFPNIRIATAYLILRPFFKPIKSPSSELAGDDGKMAYLAQDNWVLDMDSPDFPNSVPGRGQELSDATHPHLDLSNTMTSLPLVRYNHSYVYIYLVRLV
jgi:hypothetical protein